jgi:hypothetical protein
MQRGQASIEVVLGVVLSALALAAGIALTADGWRVARDAVDEATAAARRGQATVEIAVLAPVLAVFAVLLIGGWVRLADIARAERALAIAQAAISAGEPIPPVEERFGAVVRHDGLRLVVRVPSPLADVILETAAPVRS